jgi:glycosyltransferase involved in cell wall biosynthesis
MCTLTGILCCFNSRLLIEPVLESIGNQTSMLEELIIVDDCSEDDTIGVIERYLSTAGKSINKVQIIRNSRNLGVSLSANIAMKNCKTEGLIFFSHDDFNYPERIQKTKEAFKGGAKILCSSMAIPASNQVSQVPVVAEEVALRMCLSNIIPAPTVAISTESVERYKLFFNPQCQFADDYDLWCYCILEGLNFTVIDEVLVDYKTHAQQMSVANHTLQVEVAEKIRRRYVRTLFPFCAPNQSTTLLDILVNQPHLIRDIPLDFSRYFIQGMRSSSSSTHFQSIYNRIENILV